MHIPWLLFVVFVRWTSGHLRNLLTWVHLWALDREHWCPTHQHYVWPRQCALWRWTWIGALALLLSGCCVGYGPFRMPEDPPRMVDLEIPEAQDPDCCWSRVDVDWGDGSTPFVVKLPLLPTCELITRWPARNDDIFYVEHGGFHWPIFAKHQYERDGDYRVTVHYWTSQCEPGATWTYPAIKVRGAKRIWFRQPKRVR